MLADRFGAWPIGAGLLAMVGTLAVANWLKAPEKDSEHGQTTEIAALVTFVVRDGSDAVVLHQLKDVFHSSGQLDLIMVKPPDNSEVPAT